MNMKEMDEKGKLRFQLNDLITNLPARKLKLVLAYVEAVHRLHLLEEEAKEDIVRDIKDEHRGENNG